MAKSNAMRVRFPPSPTGRLHIGNVRTALYNWLLARKAGGVFVLRIEDTDAERSTRANEERMLEDLRWLGLDWDEGPGAGGPHEPYRQSERLEAYRERSGRLLERGLAYHCFCTPEELKSERERALAEGRPPRYSGRCRDLNPDESRRRLEAGEPAAVRFRIEQGPAVAWDDLVHGNLGFERGQIGDFVIVRSDGSPAYNYAVVVDDALMEISHVIRGDDHISNTPRQILLCEALGFRLPHFGHLPMILGPDGSRLSKRHGATSVEEFRARGYLPGALLNYLALLGWNPGDEREFFLLDELIKVFSLKRVNRSAAVFDIEKLDWLNGRHLRALPPGEALAAAAPFLRERGYLLDGLEGAAEEWARDLADAFAASSPNLIELAESCAIVFNFDPQAATGNPEVAAILDPGEARSVLEAFLEETGPAETLDVERFRLAAKVVGKRTGARGKALYFPLRAAITGAVVGPELDRLVPLLEAGKNLPLPVPVTGVRARIAAVAELLREG